MPIPKRSTRTSSKPAVGRKTRVDSSEPKGTTNQKSGKPREADSPRGEGVIRGLSEGEFYVSYQASELVPVAQYANVTIGPIQVATVTSGDPEAAIENCAKIVTGSIARDRAVVEESIREHNRREEEAEAAKKGTSRRRTQKPS